MKIRFKLLPLAVLAVTFFNVSVLFAQNKKTSQSRSVNQTPDPATQIQEYTPNQNVPATSNAAELLINEIGQLRKSLQTISARLRELSEKFSASNQGNDPNEKQKKILLNLDILTRAEQRAELLRKQLIELVEKENAIRTRTTQIEEEMRPENIERNLATMGTTRAPELRDARKRTLENERNGLQNLLNQIYQSRIRLEEDVKEADLLVSRMRQRVLVTVEKEVQSITPN